MRDIWTAKHLFSARYEYHPAHAHRSTGSLEIVVRRIPTMLPVQQLPNADTSVHRTTCTPTSTCCLLPARMCCWSSVRP